MNTITSVRPYVGLKNNPQAPATQPQAPAFKGVIGKSVVEKIAKEPLTIATILAMVSGVIGLSEDKVSDVLESLVDRIKGLQTDNANLTQQVEQLQAQLEQKEKMKTEEKARYGALAAMYRTEKANNEEQKTRLEATEAQLFEMQQYFAKVKPVDEIDTVMPEQFIATLQDIEEHNEAAHKSLFEYVMTGKGQEEFLAQMGRNEIILKGIKDGIEEIPEVKEALKKTQKSAGLGWLAAESYCLASAMLDTVLRVQPKASYIQSPAIYAQVKANAEALINPMMDERPTYDYRRSVNNSMERALEFQINLEKHTNDLLRCQPGLILVEDTIDPVSTNKSYRTFKNDRGDFEDISLSSLSVGRFYESRVRTPEGEIIRDDSRINK